jgi:hypothetical protein
LFGSKWGLVKMKIQTIASVRRGDETRHAVPWQSLSFFWRQDQQQTAPAAYLQHT